MHVMNRRILMLGGLSALGGCSAISTLNDATKPLDTYDLSPVAGPGRGARRARTLLVARPQATAALTSDRIMIKPDALSITYLPDARWSDEVPAIVQTLLIRSISGTGRVAYVGQRDGGPIPDRALLSRVDAFEVVTLPDGALQARIDMDLTVINDADQRIVGSRRFAETAPVAGDDPRVIVAAFQTVLNTLLPEMSDWAVRQL